MTDLERLIRTIKDSGMTLKAVADKSGIPYHTFARRLKGYGEFTASQIANISKTLRLRKTERDEIFLDYCVTHSNTSKGDGA